MIITCSYSSSPPKTFVIESNSIIIGRRWGGQQVDLDLSEDKKVSRRHARLTCENGEYWIEDLGSKRGTWVNEQQIATKTRLKPEDKVQVGRTIIEAQMEATPPTSDPLPEIPLAGDISYTIDATQPPFARPGKGAPDDALAQAQRRLKVFYDLSQALGTAATLERLLQILVEELQSAIPRAQRGAVLLRGEQGKLLLKVHWPPGKHSVSKTWAERACAEREAFIWTASDERNDNIPASVLQYQVQSAIYAPLLWKYQVLGVVYVDNHGTREAFTPDDVELLSAIANQAAMFVKNHALQQELRHEEMLRSNLLRQFSPKIAERLLQERGRLRLGGERVRPVTILLSDVRDFTTLSAQMEPDEVVQMLNEMFGACLPIIFEYDGTVDKFIGDAILAVFGSPEPDSRQWQQAVRAALDIQQAMHELKYEWQRRGLPVFQVGISVHTGEVLHGFIGSSDRMEYTVIGDTVNRTRRYCDGASGGEVIISRDVYEHVYRSVDVVPRTIKTKHPEIEPDLEAYVVKGLKKAVA